MIVQKGYRIVFFNVEPDDVIPRLSTRTRPELHRSGA